MLPDKDSNFGFEGGFFFGSEGDLSLGMGDETFEGFFEGGEGLGGVVVLVGEVFEEVQFVFQHIHGGCLK